VPRSRSSPEGGCAPCRGYRARCRRSTLREVRRHGKAAQ
jgi:hypothetical protein